jgi:hypothetical protein
LRLHHPQRRDHQKHHDENDDQHFDESDGAAGSG